MPDVVTGVVVSVSESMAGNVGLEILKVILTAVAWNQILPDEHQTEQHWQCELVIEIVNREVQLTFDQRVTRDGLEIRRQVTSLESHHGFTSTH